MPEPLERTCTKCGLTKPLQDFRFQKRDGGIYPTSQCRKCLNAYSREFMRRKAAEDPAYKEAHRERDKSRWEREKNDPAKRSLKNLRMRLYQQRPEVQERQRAKSKEWIANNLESYRQRQAEWRAANPEKLAEYVRRHREKDPEKARLLGLLRRYVRRHRIFNQGGRFTIHQSRLCREFWGHRCAYCGRDVEKPKDERKNFDHVIPVAEGGDNGPGNIVLACTSCNFSKGKRLLPEEVLERLRPQLELFVSLLPAESYVVSKNAPTSEVVAACAIALPLLRGRGAPLGIRLGSAA
jgi:5-methylcytosine-specific restriction endonuclease McrA